VGHALDVNTPGEAPGWGDLVDGNVAPWLGEVVVPQARVLESRPYWRSTWRSTSAPLLMPSCSPPVGAATSPRSNWNATFRRAADAIGLPAVRTHELRHTGATLAGATGATTKEFMRRLGHSSPAAALVYQHAADDRDAEIARALDVMLEAAAPEERDDERRLR
jgi:integrase